MKHKWFRPRGYRHFDRAVGDAYADKACDPDFVAKHSWSPLLHYVKRVKRYRPISGKTEYKSRSIMFASHRDACILSKYAADISGRLDDFYKNAGLDKNVIAYRKLGRANYHFSADAYRFAMSRDRCVILCFDITGFFDNLDHALLKDRLKGLLKLSELPKDWFSVFKRSTKFCRIERDALLAVPAFKARLEKDTRGPIATIAEVKAAHVPIISNPNGFGIPQGIPISAALSNLYMLEVDRAMAAACVGVEGMYQRYSDDILVICPIDREAAITGLLKAVIGAHKLEMKDEKKSVRFLNPVARRRFSIWVSAYLGTAL